VYAVGKISAHIAGDAGGSRGESDQADGAGLLCSDGAGFFQAGERGRGIKKQCFDVGELCEYLTKDVADSFDERRIKVEADAARDNPASPEAAATDAGGEVNDAGSQAPERRCGQSKTDICGDAAERGEMHRYAFQFCGNAAHSLLTQCRRNSRERFDGGAKCHRMSNNRVAGYRLNEYELLRWPLSRQKLFEASMLVTELDFKMKNLLAVA